jgi:hypothetical protein
MRLSTPEKEPIKIFKGIPVPIRHRAPRIELRRTFARLSIGAAFDLPAGEINRSSLYRLAQAAGIRIAVSGLRDTDGQLYLYRIWRLE